MWALRHLWALKFCEIDLEEKSIERQVTYKRKNKEETLSYLNPNLKYLYLEPRVFFKKIFENIIFRTKFSLS